MPQPELPRFYEFREKRTPDVLATWCTTLAVAGCMSGTVAIITGSAMAYYALTNQDLGAYHPLWALVPLLLPSVLFLTWAVVDRFERRQISCSGYALFTKECIKRALHDQNPEYGEELCDQLADKLMHLQADGAFKYVPNGKGTRYIAPTLHSIERDGDGWLLVRCTSEKSASGEYRIDKRTEIRFKDEGKKANLA